MGAAALPALLLGGGAAALPALLLGGEISMFNGRFLFFFLLAAAASLAALVASRRCFSTLEMTGVLDSPASLLTCARDEPMFLALSLAAIPRADLMTTLVLSSEGQSSDVEPTGVTCGGGSGASLAAAAVSTLAFLAGVLLVILNGLSGFEPLLGRH